MSKTYSAAFPCGACGNRIEATLFRTLWIEVPENRLMVFEDRVNAPLCGKCGTRNQIDASLMATNKEMNFAVWYDPEGDPDIDKMAGMFVVTMGEGNYMSTAPKVADWDEFKRTIEKFESGELVGKAPIVGDIRAGLDAAVKADMERARGEKKPGFLGRLFGKKG